MHSHVSSPDGSCAADYRGDVGVVPGFAVKNGNARRSSTSPTARLASRKAASVCGLAAASEFAMVMRPNGWRAYTHGRSALDVKTQSSGS